MRASLALLAAFGTILVPMVGAQPIAQLDSPELPETLRLGDVLTVRVHAVNFGSTANDGRLHLAFPGLRASQILEFTSDSGTLVKVYPEGEPIEGCAYGGNACPPLSYPMVQARYEPWTGAERHYLEVKVRPDNTGPLQIEAKVTMHGSSGWTGDPSTGERDQQGEYVDVYEVDVERPRFASASAIVLVALPICAALARRRAAANHEAA